MGWKLFSAILQNPLGVINRMASVDTTYLQSHIRCAKSIPRVASGREYVVCLVKHHREETQ